MSPGTHEPNHVQAKDVEYVVKPQSKPSCWCVVVCGFETKTPSQNIHGTTDETFSRSQATHPSKKQREISQLALPKFQLKSNARGSVERHHSATISLAHLNEAVVPLQLHQRDHPHELLVLAATVLLRTATVGFVAGGRGVGIAVLRGGALSDLHVGRTSLVVPADGIHGEYKKSCLNRGYAVHPDT